VKLIIEDDEGKTTVYPMGGREVTVGRKEGNTIRLMERNVSRRHARLFEMAGRLVIEDLDSYNGIHLNGERVLGRAELQAGDLVIIGDYHLGFQPEDDEDDTFDVPVTAPSFPLTERPAGAPLDEPTTEEVEAADPTAPPEPEPEEQPSVLRVHPQARLVAVSTELAGVDYVVRGDTVVGRVEDCDVVIDHPSVSRRHARFIQVGNRLQICDLGSANGVLVNDELCASRLLASHDRVELGHVQLRFVPGGEPFRPGPREREALEEAGVQVAPPPDVEDAASRAVTVSDARAGVRALTPELEASAAPAARSSSAPTARFRRPPGGFERTTEGDPPRRPAPAGRPEPAPESPTTGRVVAALLVISVVTAIALAWAIWSRARADDTWDRALRAEFEQGRFEDVMKMHAAHATDFADPEAARSLREDAEEKYVQDVLQKANAALEIAQADQAIELLQACLSVAPEMTACHWSMGVAYARNQQPEDAARHYRRFVELAPEDARVPQVLEVLRAYESSAAAPMRAP